MVERFAEKSSHVQDKLRKRARHRALGLLLATAWLAAWGLLPETCTVGTKHTLKVIKVRLPYRDSDTQYKETLPLLFGGHTYRIRKLQLGINVRKLFLKL